MGKYIDLNKAKTDFSYDPTTGQLTWKVGKFKGEVAGSVNGCGYLIVDWQGSKWYAHRIIATLLTQRDISHQVIDHRDYNKLNNKPDNVVVTSQRENVLRRRLKRSNRKFKYQGIEKRVYSYGVRYRAVIVVNGKKLASVPYRTQKEAYKAYLQMFAGHNSINDMPPSLAMDYVTGLVL